MRASAQQKQLQLDLYIFPNVPTWIQGDPTRLRQILGNLLGNAIKFTENGFIKLTASAENDPLPKLRLVVQDTGIGIPIEVIPELFQAFHQADASTTRKFGGTGLGLVICKKLVNLMGGEIFLESQVGKGTSFTVVLPLVLAAPA